MSQVQKDQTIHESVSNIERSSYSESAKVLAMAFMNDPVVCAIRRVAPDVRVKQLNHAFSSMLPVCGRKGWLLQIKKDSKIAGVAGIYPPGAYPLSMTAQLEIITKTILGNGFHGLGRWLTWLKAIEKNHPKVRTHYYLECIGVTPNLHGKGLGSAILQHIVNRANSEKVGIYLETGNSRNLPFYEMFGFHVEAQQKIIGVPTWFMWRPPAS